MFVSPRFRDIFSPRAIQTRYSDKGGSREEPGLADSPPVPDAESIWLEITAAHRRAARAFTPERLRLEDLASDEA